MTLRYRSGDVSNSAYWGYVWARYKDGSNRIRLSFEPGRVYLLEQYAGACATQRTRQPSSLVLFRNWIPAFAGMTTGTGKSAIGSVAPALRSL